MTYSPAQPQNLPSPSVAVDQIRNNFSSYATVFDNNHVALNANNQGKHSNVILQRQITDPIVNSNFVDLFSKLVTTTSGSSDQIFATIPKFIPNQNNDPQQLTFNSVNTAGPVYQSFMVGGFILYFGNTTNIAPPINISPPPKNILCVIANGNGFTTAGTPTPFNASVKVNSTTQFQISSSNATGAYTFSWFVIGEQ